VGVGVGVGVAGAVGSGAGAGAGETTIAVCGAAGSDGAVGVLPHATAVSVVMVSPAVGANRRDLAATLEILANTRPVLSARRKSGLDEQAMLKMAGRAILRAARFGGQLFE
jgi:hypothetical protein